MRQRELKPREIKICPVCNKEFESIVGSKKVKTTCSHSCANVHFRTGPNHSSYKDISEYTVDNKRDSHFSKKYRQICFSFHNHKCVVCEENRFLDVHHLDGNKMNNNPSNLIPLCPTHHRYVHSEYAEEVMPSIEAYIKDLNCLMV